jgi:hypothetical protein
MILRDIKQKIKKIIKVLSFSNIFNKLFYLVLGIELYKAHFGRRFFALSPRGMKIGKNVEFGDNVRLQGREIHLNDNERSENKCKRDCYT